MLYELCIACCSVASAFLLYFKFNWLFASKDQQNDNDNYDDDVAFDERHDLDGKELLFVSLVREDKWFFWVNIS